MSGLFVPWCRPVRWPKPLLLVAGHLLSLTCCRCHSRLVQQVQRAACSERCYWRRCQLGTTHTQVGQRLLHRTCHRCCGCAAIAAVGGCNVLSWQVHHQAVAKHKHDFWPLCAWRPCRSALVTAAAHQCRQAGQGGGNAGQRCL